jgi:hypothetical protein
VDVVVAGGGPTGIAAAVSAARHGARTLLLEKEGFLGGNAAMWLPLLCFLDVHGNQVIRGIPQEIVERMKVHGAATKHYPCALHQSYTIYDPEIFKWVAQEMLLEAGVDILLHTLVADAPSENGSIQALIIENKSGRQAVTGEVYIDATGDGDLAVRAGAPWEKGDEDGGLQPPTLMFTLRNVDVPTVRRALVQQPDRFRLQRIPPAQIERNEHFVAVGLADILEEARANGDWDLPNSRVILISTTREDEVAVNTTRVPGTDGTVAESLTNAELVARQQIDQVVALLRKYVPGFEEAQRHASAHAIGIRETRRILGEYVLTVEDVLEGRRFDDQVLLAGYMVDIHNPHGDDSTLIPPKAAYGIPYRCLLPRDVDNLLVAGRCISTTHGAMAATRVMVTCMATGEAAGCAAAISADGIPPRRIDVGLLQESLRRQGVVLDV